MIANRGKSAGRDISMTAGLTEGDLAGMVQVREDNTEYVLQAIDRALAEALDDLGQAVQHHAQELCPVDTGRLRNSITYTLGDSDYGFPGMGASVGRELTVGSEVEYAAYVELGTSRTRAQPFLRPAAERYSDEYRSIVEGHMRDGE